MKRDTIFEKSSQIRFMNLKYINMIIKLDMNFRLKSWDLLICGQNSIKHQSVTLAIFLTYINLPRNCQLFPTEWTVETTQEFVCGTRIVNYVNQIHSSFRLLSTKHISFGRSQVKSSVQLPVTLTEVVHRFTYTLHKNNGKNLKRITTNHNKYAHFLFDTV